MKMKEDTIAYKKYEPKTLTDSELIASILEIEDLASVQQCIYEADNFDLRSINRIDFTSIPNVGEVSANRLKLAIELGNRYHLREPADKVQITSSKKGYDLLKYDLSNLEQEKFYLILLNRANYVIGKPCISTGGINGTVVDTRIVFKKAIAAGACSIILAHNHPSGNLSPSQQDEELTKKLVEAGKLLDITVLDHLIVGDQEYYSFADNAKI